MSSIVSRLGEEGECKITNRLFNSPVRLHLLYQSSHHGTQLSQLLSKFDDHGKFLVVVFRKSGSVRGGFTSKSLKRNQSFQDDNAFVFEITQYASNRYCVQDASKAVTVRSHYGNQTPCISFGDCLRVEYGECDVCFSDDLIYAPGWAVEDEKNLEVELHRVQDVSGMFPCPWRELEWTESEREGLRKSIASFKLLCSAITKARVLLLGPVGSGKSSLINSIQSAMYGRLLHLPMTGTIPDGFTKKLRSYGISAEKGAPATALTLCDVLALGNYASHGLSLSDGLAVIKGHVPEGYKFQSCSPITQKVSGYKAEPPLTDQIHCVVYVLDASKVTTYNADQQKILKSFRSAISDHDIPQLIVLTHVDEVCSQVQRDVKYVYYSPKVQEKMCTAAKLLGLPVSYVLPVKTYDMELSVSCSTDTLLLSVVQCVLQAVDDSIEANDSASEPQTPENTTKAERKSVI